MEILSGYGAIVTPTGPVVATVGNFDGVHLGHQRLIGEVRAEASRRGLPAAVVTFDPHPLRVLAPERAPRMILTRRQKIEILAAFGIDLIVIIPFTREIAAVPAEEFVRRFLTGRLHAACVIVGEDFRFGSARRGDAALLHALAPQCGFEVRSISKVENGGTRISANRIRDALAEGDIRAATAMLGRAHVLVGQVVHGHGRGRELRVPTANLLPENELIPAEGVYITETLVELEWHRSVTNIGTRPTFEGAGFAIETHIPGFERSLYNELLRIRFHDRVRGERRFASAEALRAQIAEDIRRMRAWFRSGSGAGGPS